MQPGKSFLLLVIACLFLSSSAFALDFTYTDSGTAITITGYTGPGGAVIIPGIIDGKPVVSIGSNAFLSQPTIISVSIPAGVTSLGSRSFCACNALVSVSIPDGVTSIGWQAFHNSSALASITIPGSVTSIGESAFLGCDALTNVNIPASVTSIGNYAFADCHALTSITVGGTNPNYSATGGILYNITQTRLIQYPAAKSGAFGIPPGVTSIGDGAFWGCVGLAGVSIPAGVTAIGSAVFYGCTGLTSISIPSGVTSIGAEAFRLCTGLTSISIPAGVTTIGIYAFANCTGLSIAYFYGNAPAMGTDVFLSSAGGFTVYYLASSTGFTNPWNGYPTAVFPVVSTTTPTTAATTTIGLCPSARVLGEDNPDLENLRDFRDNTLAKSAVGRMLVEIYYNNAGSINDALESNSLLQAAARKALEAVSMMVGQ